MKNQSRELQEDTGALQRSKAETLMARRVQFLLKPLQTGRRLALTLLTQDQRLIYQNDHFSIK